jgi:hypothetical protein
MKRQQLIRRVLERLGSEAVERLRNNLSKDRTRASNKLHDTMYYNIVGTNIEVFMSSYAMTVDEGRKAGARVPKGFAKDIERWMSFKGISPEGGKTRMQSARAIADSIYKRGAIKRFGYSGSNFIDRAVNNVMNEFDDDLLTAWMSGLEDELNKIK